MLDRLSGPEEVEEPTYDPYDRRNRLIEVAEELLDPQQLPNDRRRLAITLDEYLSICRPAVSIDEFRQMLSKPQYAAIRDAISLTAAGSAFIVLFEEERLSASRDDPNSIRGNRRFLITDEMTNFCAVLKRVPGQRRVAFSPPYQR